MRSCTSSPCGSLSLIITWLGNSLLTNHFMSCEVCLSVLYEWNISDGDHEVFLTDPMVHADIVTCMDGNYVEVVLDL